MDQVQITPEVRSFLDGLLEDAGMNFEPEMKEQMIKELFARLDNHIISVIVENMPPENLDEFIKLNEEKKPKEEIEKFLVDKMPNAKEVMAQAFVQFRDLYLGNVADARSAPTQDK